MIEWMRAYWLAFAWIVMAGLCIGLGVWGLSRMVALIHEEDRQQEAQDNREECLYSPKWGGTTEPGKHLDERVKRTLMWIIAGTCDDETYREWVEAYRSQSGCTYEDWLARERKKRMTTSGEEEGRGQ